jgi:hypothetical protein
MKNEGPDARDQGSGPRLWRGESARAKGPHQNLPLAPNPCALTPTSL